MRGKSDARFREKDEVARFGSVQCQIAGGRPAHDPVRRRLPRDPEVGKEPLHAIERARRRRRVHVDVRETRGRGRHDVRGRIEGLPARRLHEARFAKDLVRIDLETERRHSVIGGDEERVARRQRALDPRDDRVRAREGIVDEGSEARGALRREGALPGIDEQEVVLDRVHFREIEEEKVPVGPLRGGDRGVREEGREALRLRDVVFGVSRIGAELPVVRPPRPEPRARIDVAPELLGKNVRLGNRADVDDRGGEVRPE